MKRAAGKALLALAVALLSLDGRAAPGASDPAPASPSDPALASPPSAQGSSTLALAALDRRIADLDAEDQTAKRELDDLGSKIAEAHLRALAHGRGFYRLTRPGMLPIGGCFG